MRSVVLVLLCAFLLAGCTELLFGPGPPAPCSGSPIKLAFSPDGKTFAVAYPSELCVYDANESILHTLSIANYSFSDFAWMPDGRIVTAQSPDCPEVMTARDGGYVNAPSPGCNATDYTVTFWSANSNQSLLTIVIPGGSDDGMALSTSPRGQVAVSYSYFNYAVSSFSAGVYVIDGRNYTLIKNISTDYFSATSFSPDGKYLEVGDDFYSTPDYALLYTLSETNVYDLAWSATGNALAAVATNASSYYNEATFTLLNVNQSNGSFALVPDENFPVASTASRITSMKFSPNNRYVAFEQSVDLGCPGSEDFKCRYGAIGVLDLQTQKLVFYDDGGQVGGYPSFNWSPDGRLFYLFSGEGISDLKIVGTTNFTGG